MKARLKYSSLQRIAPRERINSQTDLKHSYNSLDSYIPTREHFFADLQNAKKFYSRLKNPINLPRRALRKNKTINTYLLCVVCSLEAARPKSTKKAGSAKRKNRLITTDTNRIPNTQN